LWLALSVTTFQRATIGCSKLAVKPAAAMPTLLASAVH
jgi:hypothetical protein